MNDKYQIKLHGKDIGKPKDLHDAMMELHHTLPGIAPSVKAAMGHGYQIHKMKEHEHAEHLRHKDGGSHDPAYADNHKNK